MRRKAITATVVAAAILGTTTGAVATAQTRDRANPTWMILESFEGPYRIITSVPEHLPEPETRQKWRWAAIIEWPYQNTAGRMPPDDLLTRMYETEERLKRELPMEAANLALTRTGNGFRRWVFYLADVGRVVPTMKRILAKFETEGVSLFVHEDPEWSHLSKVLAAEREERR